MEFMEVLKIIFMVFQILSALALIAVITLQSGKGSGLSGVVGGGSETFLGKGKAKGMDAKFAAATKWIAAAFVLLTFVLHLM